MASDTAGKRQTADLRVIGILALMALPFLCALLAAVGLLDPDIRRMVHTLAAFVPYLFVVAVAIAMLYALGFAATDIIRRWHLRHVVFPTMAGLFPLVKGGDWYDATPDAVKAVAAWTHAQAANGVRPTAAATRAALYAPATVPALPPPPHVQTLERSNVPTPNAFDIDPARSPHILIVGKTGSGKSTLARHILTRFTRRYPSEVIVCDPDGGNWLDQCSASSTEGIAEAIATVHAEFSRRQAILKEGGSAEGWTYLVLLVEETETVFERLGYAGKEIADQAQFNLREVARMGRKARVSLFAITQVAAGDVFDLHVRRNMTVFAGLSEPSVGRMLGVPKEIDLTQLAPGMVFAASTGQVLRFPDAPAVRLPLSPLYREDGSEPVSELVLAPVLTDSRSIEPVLRLDPGRLPTPAEAAGMRRLYARGWSKNRITFDAYGYKNQTVFDYVTSALEGRL